MKKLNKIASLMIILILLLSSTLISCNKKEDAKTNEPLKKTDFFMGTVVTVSLYDKKDEKVINEAFDRVKQIENEVSINKDGTELDKVNSSSGLNPIKVKDDTFQITKKGLEYSKLSEGSFDITIGPIVKLWSIGLPEAKVPTDEEIKNNLNLVGYKDLDINESDKSIFLKRKGMMIDLGGIAKGYTADEIAKVLTNHGVKDAIIDLGGNIYALGNNPNGADWKIGIQNPIASRGDIVGYIKVSNKSVVTSGIYERFIEKDGKKYHHILSPFNGYPYENELAGITIVSDKSIDGDALSTTVFSKGLKEGLSFVESMPNIDAIFITKNNEIYITSGLKENFVIKNEDFKLMN
ncbi:FAD:protein FMN transferase [Clostridium fallax]|uniref:FAD:protein FMN transferase n=1 Tax=Clostridium fallax TaxID=1533 RepID=A0A1M4WGL5_9CLOT|nr:FAD:protein FMN transferase [Clostridium fallax]SHE80376.1 thiamine biosynthesis lipoprotein [Clostridium fallax]SQB04958.1 ApbE family lipoprotein [Clostridium fallax]